MASSSSASGPVPAPPPAYAWEAQGYSDSEEEAPDPKEVASHNLVDTLLGLYFIGTLSAKSFCEVCYWAAQARVAGEVGGNKGENTELWLMSLRVQTSSAPAPTFNGAVGR
eukprot:9308260-Alexandrium_andersonii.AAC.1